MGFVYLFLFQGHIKKSSAAKLKKSSGCRHSRNGGVGLQQGGQCKVSGALIRSQAESALWNQLCWGPGALGKILSFFAAKCKDQLPCGCSFLLKWLSGETVNKTICRAARLHDGSSTNSLQRVSVVRTACRWGCLYLLEPAEKHCCSFIQCCQGVLAKHDHKWQNGHQPIQMAHGDIVLDMPEMLAEARKYFYLKAD